MKSTNYSTNMMSSSIICHDLVSIFIFLKGKCPVFHFLDLDRTILDLIRKSAKNTKMYILMFSVFILKTPAGLWNLCPDLSIHDTLKSDSVDMKISSLHGVKKMPHLAEK